MELFIIRHGESIGNNKRGFMSGKSDLDGLSEKGKIQAIRLAWELRKVKFDRIISSPVTRARETANIVGFANSASVTTDVAFSELDHGIFEGHFWWEEEVVNKIPKNWRENHREDWTTPYPEGESIKDMCERVWNGLEELIQTISTHEKVAVVAHQAVIAAISYWAKQGRAKTSGREVLDYIHTKHYPNASAFSISKKAGKYKIQNTLDKFTSVNSSVDSVRFYTNHIFHKKVEDITNVSTVSSNNVYQLDGESSAVIKILSDQESLTASRLIRLYSYLEKNSTISAPKILHQDLSGCFFGHDVIIQDYANGKDQSACIKSKHSSKQLLQDIYTNITKLHQLPLEQVQDFWYPDDWEEKAHPNWKLYMQTEINHTITSLYKTNLPMKSLAYTLRNLSKLEEYINSDKYALVPLHGDLVPKNIIVDHNGDCEFIRLVDFERARIGDALWDLVYYYGHLQRLDLKLQDAWQDCFWGSLSKERKEIFELFLTLFHAWSVRDMEEYKDDTKRGNLGCKSLNILKQLV
ncbi:hypothetical protein COW99_04685 [Candidatus Roizmanbacteria bacterium CG22_combo_CG10-13_8_21_14_all_38_20]|uniref:Protein kinase domain-containing protein n=1 Tax=Candidatus Roizmanbacteria bacterium CG22_combo_CG10-13_8_21_14_all_38_20 TaxID=1974862 RepID=A0A2H0BUI0_9BACT|nr:phosphotransferase [Candidatus Microgenomates bacterium]PIP61281.1 MAG: hypothetical protein COW99_04685 [Candidatus Roizmanbacteria bacterium CG22_combo_CG10-13_8_21_14_all_38_20]PJC31075.1 MAG: hypothetical protein CO050_04410 [Candidatus Roizmanbacteria bacterium CG_4_9_14_0_2_um_filter_38_17]